MFQDPQTRQMNSAQNVSRKKSPSDELFLHFSSKVQNLTVFSFICMIRIRFFGPGELIQNGFRRAQYRRSNVGFLSDGKRCRRDDGCLNRLGLLWQKGKERSWWSIGLEGEMEKLEVTGTEVKANSWINKREDGPQVSSGKSSKRGT